MAYSRGILDSYVETNYQNIIMEWNNAKMFNPHWKNSFKHYAQVVKSNNGKKINFISKNIPNARSPSLITESIMPCEMFLASIR